MLLINLYIHSCCGIIIFEYRISALVIYIPGDTDQYLIESSSGHVFHSYVKQGLLKIPVSSVMGYMPNTHVSSITLHTQVLNNIQCTVNVVINSP